jgi:hypothetical protein
MRSAYCDINFTFVLQRQAVSHALCLHDWEHWRKRPGFKLHGSSVSILIRLPAGWVESDSRQRQESLSHRVHTGSWKSILLLNWYWALFPRAYGGRAMKLTSAEINNAWSETSVRPYNFMTSCLIHEREREREREIRLARQVDYEYLKRVVWLDKVKFGHGVKVTARFQGSTVV